MAEHTDTIREALREYVGDGDGADETILAAHDRAVKAEERKSTLARVRSVFDMQCPPMDPDRYVDHGAYLAHDWWNTVLGGLLEDLEATDE